MSIESIFSGLHREITRLKTTVDDLNRRMVVAPLNAGKSKQLTITSGSVVATRPFILLTPESGTTDDLAFIDNGSDGKMVVLMNAREGDTITVQDYSGGGTANIDLGGDATFVLDNVHESLVLIYRESTAHWERIGLGGAGGGGATSFTDLTDAPGSYTGEAGNVVAVNATEDGLEFIAASGGAVDSVNGQTGVVVLDTDDIAEGTTNLYISDIELIKLAGIETAADVTDQANVGAAIDGATEATSFADANKFALIVSGALQWLSGANIKATLKGYFDTLYVALAGNQTVAGNKTFTGQTVISHAGTGTQQIFHAFAPNADFVQLLFGNSNATAKMGQFQWDEANAVFSFITAGHGAPIRFGNNWIYLTTTRNVGFGTDTQFGSGQGVVSIANATVVPSTNPTGAGVLYVSGGALMYRSPGGKTTTLATNV